MTERLHRLLTPLLVTVLAAGLGWVARPTPPRLGPHTTGDTTLAELVRAGLPDPTGHRGLAVAVIDGDTVQFAGLGDRGDGHAVDEHTPFEIGSVGKALTGMLLADLAEEGIVDPEEPLRAVLPEIAFRHSATADVTLAELASHRSGLPRLWFAHWWEPVAVILRPLAGRDPYAGQDTRWLRYSLGGARARGGEPTVAYSNYGMAVLGYALAARTGVPYPQLVTERILQPLGMTATGFHLDGAPLPADRAYGGTGGGGQTQPWRGSGYAPAGVGAWSNAQDLARLLAAMLAGTAPGADAATPRFPAGPDQWIGYGWFTDRVDGREVTWHNGGTGGFSAWVGFDRGAGRGVVVLGNTDQEVDPLGWWLLQATDPAGTSAAGEVPGPATDWRAWLLTGMLCLAGGIGLLTVAVRTHVDRLRLVSSGVWAGVLPALAYPAGGWHEVPPALWVVGVGLSAGAGALAVRRWPTVPARQGAAWWRWASTVGSVLLAAAGLVWVYR